MNYTAMLERRKLVDRGSVIHATFFTRVPVGMELRGEEHVVLRERSDLDIVVCNFDHGTSIVRLGHNGDVLAIDQTMDELTYNDLELNRKEWLNPQTSDQVNSWLEKRKN